MSAVALFIAIDSIAMLCLVIGIITSLLILFIITHKLKQLHTIAYLLLGNTCLCSLELCLSYLIIYGFVLRHDITSVFSANVTTPITYDQKYLCPLRSYLLFTGFSLLYTSYCLQAYYRLRQVIYYKHRCSYRNFACMIFIQWLFSVLLVLPMYLANSFEYIPTEFFCPIPFTRPLSVAYIAVTVYGVFLVIFITIYVWIYIYASRTTSVTIHRRRIIDRQFIMLKRIVLPTFTLMFLGVFYLSLFFQTILNNYETHYLTYRISYLFIAVGMSFIHLITIYSTPLIKTSVLSMLNQPLALFRRIDREDKISSMVVVVSPSSSVQNQKYSSQLTEIQIKADVIAYQSGHEIQLAKDIISLALVSS